MRITLNLDNLKIKDIVDYYGGSQDWYSSYYKRLAGCAPVAASNITMYEKRKNSDKKYSKHEFIELMNDLWNYITPGIMGVDKVEKYMKGYDKYIKETNMNLTKRKIFQTKTKNIDELEKYLKEALEKNHPVAFLNLDNGKETNLESWHWTTIIGLEIKDKNLKALISDEGYIKEIDLKLWLETTNKDGSFIYYYN